MVSFHKTPRTFSIAAVLGKVMITVFVSSCLYTEVIPSVCGFQQSPPNRKTGRNSAKKKSSRGREECIDSLGKQGGSNTKYIISPFSQDFLTWTFGYKFLFPELGNYLMVIGPLMLCRQSLFTPL